MAVFDRPTSRDLVSASNRSFIVSELEPQTDAERYARAIQSVRDHIERGDTYQANFTFPLKGYQVGDSFSCFRAIAQSQGAAYSAYLNIRGHRILSCSPELFFERRANRILTPFSMWPLERWSLTPETAEPHSALEAASRGIRG
jgi:para-aminobenzoate synthetase/4-amino-4-deoxychorismate lyase